MSDYLFDLSQTRSATFSECRRWRYLCTRIWGDQLPLVVISLNPSKANETTDDPTIKKNVKFAKAWGHGGLVQMNLFAYCSTDPKKLRTEKVDIVGPHNDAYLETETRSRRILCAWGTDGALHDRGDLVRKMLGARDLWCFGYTKNGQPKHPLYLPDASEPIRMEPMGGDPRGA